MSAQTAAIIQEAGICCDANDLMAAERVLLDGQKTYPESVDLVAALGDIRLAQGRTNKAASDYQKAIKLAPGTSKYFIALANARHASSDTQGAIDALQGALELEPDNPRLHNDIGLLCQQTGQKEAALDATEQAISLAPDNATFLSNRGRVLQDVGELEAARQAMEKSLTINPDSVDALINLGCILRDLDQPHEAVLAFQKANLINPLVPDAWLNLALALRDSGKANEGIEAITQLLTLDPQSAAGYSNLGRLQQQVFQYPLAETAFRKALVLSPENPQIMANFASLLTDMDLLDEAEALCVRVLQVHPDYVPALSNLANLVSQRGDQAQAIDLCRTALNIEPDNIKVNRNIADPLFISGRIEEAWQAYEYRWQKPDRPRRPHSQPEWQGENLAGKTLLVWPEQGVGDTLVFATCLPDVIKAAKKVIFEVDQRFVSLYQRTFPDLTVVPRQDPSDPRTQSQEIDLQCPIGALGRWTRSAVTDFPVQSEQLKADPDRVSWWQQQLSAMGTNPIKAGFYWRSGGDSNAAHSAYPALENWASILRRADVDFINLQYGPDSELAARTLADLGVKIHTPADIDLFHDIDDMAALATALDVYVGPTTLTAWLTAAVGTPALVAGLPGDWMVMGMDRLPWLPLARYIPRAPRSDWSSAFDTVEHELDSIVNSKATRLA
jgi:tetratricopeptide (TPR) repeat protein